MNSYYVYILSSDNKTIYIGVTNNLQRRVYEHKNKLVQGFTKKYNIKNLVYFEQTENIFSALEREKQLKGWTRKKKVALIESKNPDWIDLNID